MIRPATPADFGHIIAMASRFWELTRHSEPFDPEHVLTMVRTSHQQRLLAVLDLDGQVRGFVSGVLLPLLANASVSQVTELAYWIDPEARGHGRALLEELESMARAQGAKYLNMISMQSCEPSKANAIYDVMGYELIETTWSKEL